MQTILKLLKTSTAILSFVLLLVATVANAQNVANYAYSQSNGSFTPITTGGVVLGTTGNDDERFVDPATPSGGFTSTGVGFPIGFTFNYAGHPYTRIAVNANGWVSLGTTALGVDMGFGSAYTPLYPYTSSNSTQHSRIAGMAMDLQGQAGSEIRLVTIGSAPNRVCVIQWLNYQHFFATGMNLNFQIRLNEGSSSVEVVYGSQTFGSNIYTIQAGLEGLFDTDFNARQGGNWNSTTAATVNTQSVAIPSTSPVVSGLTFRWDLPAPTDVAATDVASPTSPFCAGLQPISIKVCNAGLNAIDLSLNPVTVVASATEPSGGITTNFLPATVSTGILAVNSCISVPVSAAYNLSLAGDYTFNATVSMPGDGFAGNNIMPTIIRTVAAGSSPIPLPFGIDFTGYTFGNITTYDPNWSYGKGATQPAPQTFSSWGPGTFCSNFSVPNTNTPNGTAARINLYTLGKNDWIVGPKFYVGACTKLTYDLGLFPYSGTLANATFGSDDKFQVMISTDCGGTWTAIQTWDASTPVSNNGQSVTLTLSPQYTGQQAIIAFFATEGTVDDPNDYWVYLDNVKVNDYPPIDLAATVVTSPTGNACFAPATTIMGQIAARGCGTHDFAANPATITLNVAGPSGVQTFSTVINTGTLVNGSTLNVPLTTTADLTAGGAYTIQFRVSTPGDGKISNDTSAVLRIASTHPAITATATPSSICKGSSTVLTAAIQAGATPNTSTTQSFAASYLPLGIDIPDGNTVGLFFPVTVSGYNPNATAGNYLAKICVDSLIHPYDSNIRLSVILPNNDSIVLVGPNSGVGGSGSNFIQTCFTMNSASNITTGAVPFTGNYLPAPAVGFGNNSSAVNGVWKLHVKDIFTPNQGTLYKWHVELYGDNTITSQGWSSSPAGYSSTVTSPGLISPIVTTIYTLTVTDVVGCGATVTNTVTVADPSVALTPIANVCNGGSAGKVIAVGSNGTPNYSFAWSNQTLGDTLKNVPAGTYIVTVSDLNGCANTASVVVSEPTAIVPTSSVTQPTCATSLNGTINVSATGGTGAYTYSASTGVFTPPLTGLSPGNYTITVADASGCQKYVTATLTAPAGLSSTLTPTNPTCHGSVNGSVVITTTSGNGAVTYQWVGGPAAAVYPNLGAGSYVVVSTDPLGCTKHDTVTLTQPAAITSSLAIMQPACFGGANGSVTVSSTIQGVTYHWAGGPNTATYSGLVAGKYYVTLTDGNGCTRKDTATVGQPTLLTAATTVHNALCHGSATGSVLAHYTGGSGTFYSYLWNTTPAAIADSVRVGAGSYTVTVTDEHGCTATASAVVTQSAVLAANLTATSTHNGFGVSCAGSTDGTATVTVAGAALPLACSWSHSLTQTTATATGLGAGPYSVFVTDANGCTAIAHDTIKEPSALGIQAIAFNQTVGAPANGSVQLSVTGGSGGNTFAWSNGATTQNLNTLIGGVYTVTVTNNNGCTSTASVTVNAAVATATLANGFGKVELYPNPTAGAFTLNVALTEVRELRAEVYGVTGNAVLTQAAGNTDKQQFQFDLSNLASGMYFVRIVAGGDAQVVKVILEKP